jgi:membrane associated rhomboid family serine protease
VIPIVALIVLGIAGYHFLDDWQRDRVLGIVRRVSKHVSSYVHQERTATITALRAPRLSPTTLTLAAIHVIVFVVMVLGPNSTSDPEALIGWGASLGPKTSNGEWWRLATAPFLHGQFLTLIVNTIALMQVSFPLERAVGGLLVWTAYVSAAVLSGVVHLWGYPLTVAAGAAGAMCGLYGVLLALVVVDRNAGGDARCSLGATRRFAPMAAMVLLSSLATTGVGLAGDVAGFVAGFGVGLAAISREPNETHSRRRLGIAIAVAFCGAIIGAAPLGRITDIRPEIQRLIELERTTAETYEAAQAMHQKGRRDGDALAGLIERTIVPALQEAEARFKAVRGVPAADRWRIDQAFEYLRLRSRSWLLRAEGLRDASKASPVKARSSADAAARFWSTQLKFGGAEAAERSALRALERLKT